MLVPSTAELFDKGHKSQKQSQAHVDELYWSFENGTQLRQGLKQWLDFYNQKRFHQSLDNLTLDEVNYDLPQPYVEAA